MFLKVQKKQLFMDVSKLSFWVNYSLIIDKEIINTSFFEHCKNENIYF